MSKCVFTGHPLLSFLFLNKIDYFHQILEIGSMRCSWKRATLYDVKCATFLHG